jgi:hypothetical protein
MCIDYISLNKACPKDEYPLPHICQIVDSTTSCELLSFLDAYSGYHQTSLAIDDRKNSVHQTIQNLLLHKDCIRPQEQGSYILEGHSCHLGDLDRTKYRGIH